VVLAAGATCGWSLGHRMLNLLCRFGLTLRGRDQAFGCALDDGERALAAYAGPWGRPHQRQNHQPPTSSLSDRRPQTGQRGSVVAFRVFFTSSSLRHPVSFERAGGHDRAAARAVRCSAVGRASQCGGLLRSVHPGFQRLYGGPPNTAITPLCRRYAWSRCLPRGASGKSVAGSGLIGGARSGRTRRRTRLPGPGRAAAVS
jgi:hypothetical protein